MNPSLGLVTITLEGLFEFDTENKPFKFLHILDIE